eukprot:c11809_g2_i1 orf=2-601(-)
MAKAISWVAVNKNGEVCLDSDLPPLPRGWERCLDLQSGVMYLKEMSTSSQHNDVYEKGGANYRKNAHKRHKLLLEDDDGEGDPGLQLTLSLPTCSLDLDNCHRKSHPPGQCFPSDPASSQQQAAAPSSSLETGRRMAACANSSATSKPSYFTASHSTISNGLISLSHAVPNKEDTMRDGSTSSNGSSPSYNASSSSSASS